MLETQEIILVRHGQSTANATGIWQGQLDFPLSPAGRAQARLAGRALAGEGVSALYTSPLKRAFETAAIIARESGFGGAVVPLQGLMERGGGILEGYTWPEQEARNPELVKKFLSIPEEERWSLVGAETDEEILERFLNALTKIRSNHEAGSKIVVVSHGGVLRAFLRDFFSPEVLAGSERAANASITRLHWSVDGQPPRLVDLASTAHLEDEPERYGTE